MLMFKGLGQGRNRERMLIRFQLKRVQVHLLFFMDVKQLPPATCRPIFISSPKLVEHFRFATLNENRRIASGGPNRQQELETYHQVLEDMARCRATPAVRRFVINAYVRGAYATAGNAEFEDSTSIFSKRRYRDRWNRTVVKRLARECGHNLKVHAKCKPRFSENSGWANASQLKCSKKRNKCAGVTEGY